MDHKANLIKNIGANNQPKKILGRLILSTIIFFSSGLIVIIVVFLLSSNGKSVPLHDDQGNPIPGSISEKIFIEINGVRQGMFIKSKNVSNPVLLFLHGGPGMPEYFLTKNFPTHLEDDFTVVWWEQRGSGLSYNPEIPAETMTIDQMVDDTIALTNYLRESFGKDKIYLMGHSGGSFIGILAADRAPELFYAYIGVAQMSYQIKSENLAYDYMLEEYLKLSDKKMVQKLEKAPPGMTSPLPMAYLKLRDDAMHRIGIGTTREMKSVITGIFIPSLLHPEYSLSEKINIWRGKAFSANLLRNDMFATDLTKQIISLKIPVYFFHGKYDYTCSYDLAKDFLEQLQSPVKGFYTFDNSAHSPIFEEPERVLEILQEDVLSGVNHLADH